MFHKKKRGKFDFAVVYTHGELRRGVRRIKVSLTSERHHPSQRLRGTRRDERGEDDVLLFCSCPMPVSVVTGTNKCTLEDPKQRKTVEKMLGPGKKLNAGEARGELTRCAITRVIFGIRNSSFLMKTR